MDKGFHSLFDRPGHDGWRPGLSLPRKDYTDSRTFAAEIERIFLRGWLLAGHVRQVPNVGDYFVFSLGEESFIVCRTAGQEVRAFFNVCRHRGSQLVTDTAGACDAFVCPYHSWTYSTRGELLTARAMGSGFDKSQFALHACKVTIVEGLIFLNPARNAAALDPAGEIARFLHPHGLSSAKRCHIATWRIEANWKLLIENFDECYHCTTIHPEYSAIMAHAVPESTGQPRHQAELAAWVREWEAKVRADGRVTGWVAPSVQRSYWGGRFPMRRGCVTQSRDGRRVAPLMGSVDAADGGVTSIRVFPCSHIIVCCDYAMFVRFLPESAERTRVEMQWLVAASAEPGRDFDVEKVTWLWLVTTEQDNRAVEAQQRGIRSLSYRPGPYGTTEDYCAVFLDWYRREMNHGVADAP